MLAVIGRDLNQSVVRSGPDRSFFYRGFREREDRVVVFDRSNVVGERPATGLLFAFVVTR